MSLDVFVGVDGGGSRSLAVVIDGAGMELARIEGGPGAVRPTHLEEGVAHLVSLVTHAIHAAGSVPPAASLCCGLAGAGAPGIGSRLERRLAETGLARHVRVCTDAEIAHYDAFGDGPGLLIIAGTGSIAWGRAEDGRTGRVGGWGPLLGDEGSGFAIGVAALRAVVRAADGRAPATALTDIVARHTGAAAPDSLVVWAASADRRVIAMLAPAVLDAAPMDRTARDILDGAVAALAGHVHALHSRLAPWSRPPRLAFAGSMLGPDSPLRPALISAIRASHGLEPIEEPALPARGAARMACRPPSAEGR